MKTTTETDGAQVPIDLSECEREPIHALGTVQAHGCMIVIDESSERICGASESCLNLLRMPAEDLLGEAWPPQAENWQLSGKAGAALPVGPDYEHREARIGGRRLNAYGHRHGGHIFWEFEPDGTAFEPAADAGEAWQAIIGGDEPCNAFRACQAAAEAYSQLTGYDRVMVYRFHPDWSGEVVAEVRKSEAIPFLGLRYPKTDIPPQARALFRINPTRVVGSVRAAESRLLQLTGEPPIDCSCTRLRGSSPYHLEYLSNMGVHASLVQAIIVDDQLWGLVVGHHDSPRFCAEAQRISGLRITRQLSRLIEAERAAEAKKRMADVNAWAQRLADGLSELPREQIPSRLLFGDLALINQLDADGLAIVTREHVVALGQTPSIPEIRQLADFAGASESPVFASSHLSADTGIVSSAAGMLACSLAGAHPGLWICAFRHEQRRDIYWGGDPGTPAIVDAKQRLRPRKSFDLWREMVRGQASPWRGHEILFIEAVKTELEKLPQLQRSADSFTEGIETLFDLQPDASDIANVLLGATTEGLALAIDRHDGRMPAVLTANPKMYRLLGLHPREDVGPCLDQHLQTAGIPVNSLNEDEVRFECWLPQLGHRVLQSTRVAALVVASESRRRELTVMRLRDITFNDRLVEAMRSAQETSRLMVDAQTAMIGNLSHEIRTPLNAIVGLSEMLRANEALSTEKRHHFLDEIQQAGCHLADLTEGLLEIASIQSGQLALDNEEAINIFELIESALLWVEKQATKKSINIAPIQGIELKPLLIRVEARRIRQILLNLLTNAIKYSHANGTIGVEVSFCSDSGAALITVWDTGVGIPADQLDQVFQRFHRVKEPDFHTVEGTGLGLTIVKSLVELHGGEIRLSSEPQKGTRAQFSLPASRVMEAKQ
mgnify:CR=1 FL=1